VILVADRILTPPVHHRRARQTADAIAERLRDPAAVAAIVPPAVRGRASTWGHASLAAGYAGIAMLFSNRAYRTGSADRATAHRYLAGAAHYLRGERCPSSFGIFYEACGLGLSLALAQQATGGYANALSSLDTEAARGAERYCELVDRSAVGSMARYDVIDGLSGIARYLLLRGRYPALLERVLRSLVGMLAPVEHRGTQVPGIWATNPPSRDRRRHPDLQHSGHLNLGMAHGIAGPLALLAVALAEGAVVDGQRDAIGALVELLDRFRMEDEYGVFWPSVVSLDDWRRGRCDTHRQRVSWCYGAPGISRALQLAGRATGNSEWERTAEASVAAVLALPLDRWHVDHWSVCHGWSGALHLLGYFSGGPLGAQVDEVIDAIACRLLDRLEHDGLPEFVIGHEDFPPGTEPAGFLEGAAGLALALDTYAHGPALPWDIALVLQ
jgi:hypothetical protein